MSGQSADANTNADLSGRETDPAVLWDHAQGLREQAEQESGALLEYRVLSQYPDFADTAARLQRINKWRAEGFPELAVNLAKSLRGSDADPMAVDFVLAMAELKAGNQQGGMQAYSRAASTAGFAPANAERFGIELKRVMGCVGTPAHARDGNRSPTSGIANEESRFTYALGNSQVRTLANNMGLFPLYVGGGGYTNFLFESKRRLTVETIERCIERIDTRQDILLVLGAGDVNNYRRFHDEIYAEPEASGMGPEQILSRSGRWYTELLESLRRRIRGKLFVLSALPTFDAAQTALAHVFNAVVRDYCKSCEIEYVDVVDYVTDPETGVMARDMGTTDEDAHLHQKATHEIIRRLRKAGARMGDDLSPFAWTYLFQFPLTGLIIPRVWSEPDTTGKNVVYSTMVAASQLINKASAHLASALFTRPGATLVVANCGEGLLPLSLPLGAAHRIIGLPETQAQWVIANRLLGFSGRDDVEFSLDFQDWACVSEETTCLGVVLCLEGMEPGRCRRLLEAVLEHCRDGVYALVNGGVDIRPWLTGPGWDLQRIELGNRFAPGAWRSAALLRITRGALTGG